MGAGDLRQSYDRVAGEYATRFFGELAHKPLDRALLTAFAEQVRSLGPVADLGCGPGQIARYLHDLGLPALGIDLSPEMVAQARRLNPGLTFRQGDMLALDAADAAWGGIVAFYSVIHLLPEDRPRAFREFHRALCPGGLLLLAFHVGTECLHRDELWGHPVSIDFRFLEFAALESELEAAGFAVEARLERRPYTAVEHPSRRGYLLARKPDPTA
jgi:SAM-dependent methyltransferase